MFELRPDQKISFSGRDFSGPRDAPASRVRPFDDQTESVLHETLRGASVTYMNVVRTKKSVFRVGIFRDAGTLPRADTSVSRPTGVGFPRNLV